MTTALVAATAWRPGVEYCAVGLAVALAVVLACVAKLRGRPLPGKLKARGTFQHEDPANREAVAERQRDFARICGTHRDAWIFTPTSRTAGKVLPVAPPGESEDPGKAAYTKLKFWLQEELGRIPGAVDLGMTSQWPVVDRVVAFVSVSPGFDFVMRHKVPPMLLQTKYLIMISKSGQVRVAWFSFATDKPAPGVTSGPFVLKLVSEDLNATRPDRATHSEFTYTAKVTGEKDMERILAKQLPSILKGIDTDQWDDFLKA